MKWEVYFPFFAKSMKLKLLFTVKSCQGAFPTFDVSLFSLCPDSLCSKLWRSVSNITDFLTFVPVFLISVLSQPFLLETATVLQSLALLSPGSLFSMLSSGAHSRHPSRHLLAFHSSGSWPKLVSLHFPWHWLSFTPLYQKFHSSKQGFRQVSQALEVAMHSYLYHEHQHNTQSARGDYCQIQGGPHPSNSFSFWTSRKWFKKFVCGGGSVVCAWTCMCVCVYVCTYQSQKDVLSSSVTLHVLWIGSLTESEAHRFG